MFQPLVKTYTQLLKFTVQNHCLSCSYGQRHFIMTKKDHYMPLLQLICNNDMIISQLKLINATFAYYACIYKAIASKKTYETVFTYIITYFFYNCIRF